MKAQAKRVVGTADTVGQQRGTRAGAPVAGSSTPVSALATTASTAGQVALAAAWARFEAVGWDEV